MSSAVRSLLAIAVLGASAQAAWSQGLRDRDAAIRGLLARAQGLATEIARQDSVVRREQHRERLATRFDAGAVTVILPVSVGNATGRRFAAGAFQLLDSAGVIPWPFVQSRIVVAYAATGVDSVVRAERLERRSRIMADISAAPDSLADGLLAAAVLGNAYLATLDGEWRAWLPGDMAIGWSMRREGTGAARELMAGETRAGARCLGGSVADCRLWLGLDRDSGESRYQPAEIRRVLTSRWGTWVGRGLIGECQAGSDDACEKLVREGRWLQAIPAGPVSRGSLLNAVCRLHGSEALRRALADTSGSVGERLARGTHLSEDSLVAEWRSWLLTGGGQSPVTADLRDAVPAVLVAALLLLAAARSGRWR